MAQDPNVIPWGALDRYQAHYIVRRDAGPEAVARTVLRTRGRFASKSTESVSWDGPGRLADALNADAELNTMIAARPPGEARIWIEPTDGAVRIRGGWSNHLEFGVSREMFDIYDRIAGHVRSL